MISGVVIDMQARVNVLVRSASGADVVIEFVVDTGFAGALVLPATAVSLLGLPYLEEVVANLADDRTVQTDVHVARIVFDGMERQVAVLAMGKRPLLGTSLLAGKQLVSDFVDNGPVAIADVP